MQEKKQIILYFIKGESPTESELAEAEALGTKRFRNVRYFSPESCLEACDAVAGAAPQKYLDAKVKKLTAKIPEAKADKPEKKDPKSPPPPPPPTPAATPPWTPPQA